MSLSDRGWKRREFDRLISTDLRWKYIELAGFKGAAGILEVYKTNGNWNVLSKGRKITIAAPGYKWLQLAPYHGKWWLTVMYNTEGELIQYYFDITKHHYLSDTGELRFVDMFLDIVMMPDGSYEVLDRNELIQAYQNGDISEFDYRRALYILHELVCSLHRKECEWNNLCAAAIDELNKTAGDRR